MLSALALQTGSLNAIRMLRQRDDGDKRASSAQASASPAKTETWGMPP